MSAISEQTVEAIKLVSSLNSMGETEAARILGKKIISSLSEEKDSLLFALAYDTSGLNTGDVPSLLDAAFLAGVLQEVYRSFKNVSAGSNAEYWFKSGDNNEDLHRFFMFMARSDKRLNVDGDVPILKGVIKALANNPSYKIPSGLARYNLDRFLNGLASGEIRVTREGIR